MKILQITKKNLKLLLRSKTSLLVILFGPLLIMLLVGFAFNNPSASKLNIGYYAKEKTDMTLQFVDALKSNVNFAVIEYPSSSACTDLIEQGKVHICIIFPDNFQLANNNSNEIIFYVDQSRTNFVYAIIDTVSSKVKLASNELSYQMTNDLLGVIQHTKASNLDSILKMVKMKTAFVEFSANFESMKANLNSLDFTPGSIGTGELTTLLIETDLDSLKDETDALIDAAGCVPNLTGRYEPNINDAINLTYTDLFELDALILNVSSDLAALNLKLDKAKTASSDSVAKITAMQASLASIQTDLNGMKTSLESVNAEIDALKVTSAESIVNPITTTIKPVSSKSNNLNFIFPYLVILIIVFISIMLSSTIIIMEKNSKAYFRNFITPTKAFTFIASVFLTNLFVVVFQLVLILILAYYFLQASILSNVGLTLLVIFVSITLFTLIGMAIGYMFRSQEAATMTSISVGSVFLFLSNLILPLETMSVYIQKVARFNPYVVSSELLKKLTLFNSSWKDIQFDFALLGAYILVIFLFVLLVERISRIQYINKKPLHKLAKKDEILDKYFKLKSGVLLKNEKDLLEELKNMSNVTFDEYVDKNKNDFETWLIMDNKPKLAEKIGSCRTREDMIKILEKETK